jgi:hypothetical protein
MRINPGIINIQMFQSQILMRGVIIGPTKEL